MGNADQQPTVLVVEDNPTNLKLVQAALRRSCRVLEASSGQDALRLLNEERPDLILMDIGLPGMSGIDLTLELRSRQHFTGPIVALTAHAMPSDRQEAIDAGCTAFITKPVNTRTLVDQVAQLIRVGRSGGT